MLIKWLSEIKDEKTIIEISRENIVDENIIGIILEVNDNFVLISEISVEGVWEGFVIIKIEDITTCATKGRFLNSLESISSEPSIDPFLLNNASSMTDILKHKSVYFELYQEEYDTSFHVVKLLESDYEYMKLTSFGDIGKLDTKEVIILESSVTKIAFETRYINNIIKLKK